jgi:MerR family copper efflux transcriptional regulator
VLQIGELAERAALSLRTVRYYEEMGLLVPERRTGAGERLYAEAHPDRLALIKEMKPFDFTVQQIRHLLAADGTLINHSAGPCDRERAGNEVKRFAAAATRRCDELRAQLERAEEFAAGLRRKTQRSAAIPARG